MTMAIQPYFQNYYKVFNKHRFMKPDKKNNKNDALNKSDLNIIIDAIFNLIKSQYKDYQFWNNKKIVLQFEQYIAKCCEFCWIMVLNTPQLYFYPRLFTQKDADKAKSQYDENVKYIYSQTFKFDFDDNESDILAGDGDAETIEAAESDKKKKKRKKKDKKNKKKIDDDNDAVIEEEIIHKIVKEQTFNPFSSTKFDDKYYDYLNLTTLQHCILNPELGRAPCMDSLIYSS